MKPSFVIILSLCTFFLASQAQGQDPLPVLRSSWRPATQKAGKVEPPQGGPAKQVTGDDTVIARSNREFSTDHPDNPSDLSPDGRRAAIERNEREADAPRPKDVPGFLYSATVRNDAENLVKVVFWEYKFTDRANPANSVRRQFLCSIDIKKGAESTLNAFSTFGPADAIDAKVITATGSSSFDEAVRVNRIEYADGQIVQRGDWKFTDVKAAVERAVSKPWMKGETCRMF
ncbi:MAG TPA: hypothetical protein VL501_04975 [Pyrinomonadaceae bacterium]|nr:hypothetical protein [Pyrinomonadaceae bacterium]